MQHIAIVVQDKIYNNHPILQLVYYTNHDSYNTE